MPSCNIIHSQVLRTQCDQLLKSKAPNQQNHKLLRNPIRKPGTSETLQRLDHACSCAVAGISESFQGGFPSWECFLCLPRMGCCWRSIPQPTLLQLYFLWLVPPHSPTLFLSLLLLKLFRASVSLKRAFSCLVSGKIRFTGTASPVFESMATHECGCKSHWVWSILRVLCIKNHNYLYSCAQKE